MTSMLEKFGAPLCLIPASRTRPIYHKMLFMTCVFPAGNQKTDGVPNTHIRFLRLLAQEPPMLTAVIQVNIIQYN